ncbi:hypothetical protein IKF84_00115 [Candidatus Saccharibacteria bacterium]|nr:hypothetical protein [Candidatus Saccharibacteria bacterium]
MPSDEQTRTIGPDAGSTTYVNSFSPVLGGYYRNGSLDNAEKYGRWWGNESTNGALRSYLGRAGTSLHSSDYYRYGGIYIRCIQAS